MADQYFSGGTHTHNHYYNPPQQMELQLENKSAIVPVRFYEREKKIIAELAERRGKKTSEFIRGIVLKYLKSEKQLHDLYRILDEIL